MGLRRLKDRTTVREVTKAAPQVHSNSLVGVRVGEIMVVPRRVLMHLSIYMVCLAVRVHLVVGEVGKVDLAISILHLSYQVSRSL